LVVIESRVFIPGDRILLLDDRSTGDCCWPTERTRSNVRPLYDLPLDGSEEKDNALSIIPLLTQASHLRQAGILSPD
jgi:hypothetical protein